MDNQFLDSDLETTPPQYKNYAGFWERFGAAFLDGLILFVVGQLVMGAFGMNFLDLMQSAARKEDPFDIFGNKYYGVTVVNILISLYYHAQQESSEHQATLGKRAVGLVVTDLQGQRLSFQQAALRFLMKQLFAIIAVVFSFLGSRDLAGGLNLFSLLGYIIQPFTPKKQAFHDMVAKTLVYHK
jgi:uncharacterized RDD family membrane protein YckC